MSRSTRGTEGTGCVLTFTHELLPSEFHGPTEDGWGKMFNRPLSAKTYVLAGKAVDAHDVRAQQYVDAFVPKQLQNRLSNLSIFTGGKLRAAFDQRYPSSHCASVISTKSICGTAPAMFNKASILPKRSSVPWTRVSTERGSRKSSA